MDSKNRCDVCGKRVPKQSIKQTHGQNLCPKHYYQLYTKGEVIDDLPYSRQSKQVIDEVGGGLAIIRIIRQFEENLQVIIDEWNIKKVSKYKWHYHKGSKTIRCNSPSISLPRLLTGTIGNKRVLRVWHIDKDPLNNTEENLEVILR